MQIVSVLLVKAVVLKSWKTAFEKLDNNLFFVSRNSVPVTQDIPQTALSAIFGGNISSVKKKAVPVKIFFCDLGELTL